MSALAAGLLAAGAVGALAASWTRPPERVRSLLAAATPPLPVESPRPDLLARVGFALLRVFRPRATPTPEAARHAVVVAFAFVVGTAFSTSLGVLLAASVAGWPVVRRRRAARERAEAMAAGMPEVVDLFGVAVGAGLTVHLAVPAVARRATGPVAAELRWVVDQVGLGRDLADALDDLPARAGEAVRPLAAALAASVRYGAPISAGLERLAAEVRVARQRRAEAAARKVPVKLLFPLVLCILPAFALLTVAPLVAGALGSLRL